MNETELQRRLYLPNFEHWRRHCSKNFFSDRKLEVRTVENGIILPTRRIEGQNQYHCRGGVCDEERNFVAGYNNQPPGKKNGAYCIDEAYPIEPKELELFSDEVIFGGILVCHFGHFITECLSRMWYVVENPEDRRRVVFIMLKTSPLQELKNWVYQFFDLLGLPEDRVVILEKPAQFRAVLVPDQSVRIKYDYTREFMLPFKHIARRIRPFNAKKLFLTRGKNLKSAMTLVNQEYFEQFFQQRGFQVIAPEELSVIDQIALITGADEVATFLGTLAHWSLFSHVGAKWTFLNRVDEIASRQCLINDAVGIDWYFVSCAMNFLYAEQGGGVCLLGSTDYWKAYALEHYGIRLDPNARMPGKIVDDYIERWCKYFGSAASVKKRISTLENLYSRISLTEAKIKLKRPVLCYQLHSAQRGWLPVNIEGDIGGAIDKKYELQALRIYFSEPAADVFHSVYYPKEGWTKTASNRMQSGTTGKDKSIYGLRIKLGEDLARKFDVVYRIHNVDGVWSERRRNGEELVSENHALDGVQIELVLKDSEREF